MLQQQAYPLATQKIAAKHDLSEVASQLSVKEDDLKAALDDPSKGRPDFEAAAEALGVTEEALRDAMVASEPDAGPAALQGGEESLQEDCGLTVDGFPEAGCEVPIYTFADAPVDVLRWDASGEIALANGETHTYEAFDCTHWAYDGSRVMILALTTSPTTLRGTRMSW